MTLSRDQVSRFSKEWDTSLNGLTFEEFLGTRPAKELVFWTCSRGHSYKTSLTKKVSRNAGCPYCSNARVLTGFNDVSTTHPEWVNTWDFSLNTVPPTLVIAGSEKSYWFKCPEGHSFKIALASKSRGRGCNVCSGKVVLEGVNDLLSQRPEIAARLDPSSGLDPSKILAGTGRNLPFLCAKGHLWKVPPKRIRSQDSCAICSNQQLVLGINSLEILRPDLLSEFHKTKNVLSFDQLSPSDKRKVWWQCSKGHEWDQSVQLRRAAGCPICRNLRVNPGVNDLLSQFSNIASEWDYEKNLPIQPDLIAATSRKRVWWRCALGHSWQATLSTRTLRGFGCPVCAGRVVQAGFNDLVTLYPDVANQLDESKSKLSASAVHPGSHKRLWWRCLEDELHNWQASVYSVVVLGSGCPVCTNQKIIAGVNDLATHHPQIAAEWHPTLNGGLKPSESAPSSTSLKIWWQCQINSDHIWKTSPAVRVRGSGCPGCSKSGGFDRTEPGILYFLESKSLLSYKVGITNSNATEKRLLNFQKQGWTIIKIWDFSRGDAASDVENSVFKWIRTDLQIPIHLGPESVPRLGGWSETFSSEAVREKQVIQKIEELVAEFKNLEIRSKESS
jgi:hypothetical protein